MAAIRGRLLSLDAFRGAAIAAMILVNNPLHWDFVYPQLRHAHWHGWTFTDAIFPFFLFIVGASLSFSLAVQKRRGERDSAVLLRTFRRFVVLFLLGIALTGFPHYHLSTLRIPGVLQRIALCSLFASLIAVKCRPRMQALLTALLLASYWIMLKYVPVPGVGAGVLEPGKTLPDYLDFLVLGNHIWSPATPMDPEGLLGTIPAIASTMFGVLTGEWLQSERHCEGRSLAMLQAGGGLVFLGLLLNTFLPINKNLWTSSYSVFMGGWALVAFAAFYWLIDEKRLTRWTGPLLVYGTNSIAAYSLSVVLARLVAEIEWPDAFYPGGWVNALVFGKAPIISAEMASLLHALFFVGATYLIVWIMYKNRWFLKI